VENTKNHQNINSLSTRVKAMTKVELQEYINTAADQCLADCKTENPLESWTRFIDRLDGIVRRRIGDALEQSGKNRYTGRKKDG
jgi:hypothetical protein